MEAVISMNPTIWVFAAILILLVLVQSALFLRLALRFNKKNLLVSRQEINSAVRTGAVAAIGPSLNSIVVALSLIAMVGSATTFMRCGVIGAPLWELYMANIAASAAGVTFGSTEFTKSVMTLCLFCMVFGWEFRRGRRMVFRAWMANRFSVRRKSITVAVQRFWLTGN